MSHRYKPNENKMSHREKIERAIVKNEQMQRIFNPIVDKVKASYGANTYDSMLVQLSVELTKKNIPFTMENFERQELTVEGLCQGIWEKKALNEYVEAGLAEKRYDLELYDELIRNPDNRFNEDNKECELEYD